MALRRIRPHHAVNPFLVVIAGLAVGVGCDADDREADSTDALTAPRSTAMVPHRNDSLSVTVSKTGISVAGEQVVDLPLDASEIRGGDAGLAIIALLDALESIIERKKGNDDGSANQPRPSLALTVDRSTSYGVLSRVLYTAGQAGIYRYRLVVRHRDGSARRDIRFYTPRLHASGSKLAVHGTESPGRRVHVSHLGHLGHHLEGGRTQRDNVLSEVVPDTLGAADARESGERGLSPDTNSKDPTQETDEQSASESTATEKDSEAACRPFLGPRSLELQVGISPEGFEIGTRGSRHPSISSCPDEGPTICLRDEGVDVEQKLRRVRELLEDDPGDEEFERVSGLVDRVAEAYDWRTLYEKLVDIKNEYPKKTGISLSASTGIPFALVVRTLDVARFRLGRETFETAEAFDRALWEKPVPKTPQGNMYVPEALFSDPVLSTVR